MQPEYLLWVESGPSPSGRPMSALRQSRTFGQAIRYEVTEALGNRRPGSEIEGCGFNGGAENRPALKLGDKLFGFKGERTLQGLLGTLSYRAVALVVVRPHSFGLARPPKQSFFLGCL